MSAKVTHALSALRLAFRFPAALALLALAAVPAVLSAQVQFTGAVGVVPINGVSLGGLSRAVSDGAGNLYIADPVNNDVVKVDTSDNATILLGASNATYTWSLNAPGGIAINTSGTLYIADTGNNEIVVLPRGGPASALNTGGTATPSPSAVAVDPSGNVWVAMTNFGHVYAFNSGFLYDDLHPTGANALNNPQGLAVDGSYHVYIADYGAGHVIDDNYLAQTVTVVSTGSISLVDPAGLGVDLDGNLYIADYPGNQVVEVTPSGASVVNTGSLSLLSPVAISFDGQNNVYISDGGHERVLEFNNASVDFGSAPLAGSPVSISLPFAIGPASQFGSVAVNDGPASSPDFTPTNGTCTSGVTSTTCSVQVSFSPHFMGLRRGTLVLYDPSKTVLATVPLSGIGTGPLLAFTPGIISTLAGNGQEGYALGGGLSQPASQAEFVGPKHLAVDDADRVYVADGDDAVRLEFGGLDKTVAGGGVGEGGDGGPATQAGLTGTSAVALDASGDIFITDPWGNWVREVSEPSGIINAFAGLEHVGYLEYQPQWAGDGGPATQAYIYAPNGLATDGIGNVYIADTYNQVVRKVNIEGGITTVAGNYALGAGYAGDNGPATSAQLNYPEGLAVDTAGNLYIADVYNNVIRKVTPDGTISTFAGNHTLGAGYTGDNGPANQAQVSIPNDIAVDGGGNLYIADYGNFAIRMVSAVTGNITTVAGGTNCPSPWNTCFSGDGGQATAAQMTQPNGIAVDPSGNIFFSDLNNLRIRQVNVSGPPTLAFPNTTVGSTSAEQTVNLSDLGNAPLSVTSIQLPAGFVWGPDTSCKTAAAFQIQPGTSCELAIEFSPTVSGNYSSTVLITQSSPGVAPQVSIPLVAQGAQIAQTITFTPPASPVPYSTGLTIPLVATGGASGNPVVFSIDPASTGTGVISASTLNVSAGGTFVIDANQAGTTLYAAAPQVQVTVQVTLLQQTITLPTPVYPPLAQGSFTLPLNASSGLPITYTILNGTGTLNGNVLTFAGAGAVQLQANQAGNSVYSPAPPVNGTVDVVPTMNPPSGTPLTGASQTFSWTAGGTSNQYSVEIGDQGAGSTNVLSTGLITTPSVSVSNIPLNGKTLHVFLRIYLTAGGSDAFDFTYQELTAVQSVLATPAPGNALPGSSTSFSWTPGTGVSEYFFQLGTTGPGSSNLFNTGATTALSASVSGLPTNGETIYARVGSKISGVWQTNDYTYTAAATPAALTSPAPGSALTGVNVSFSWNAGLGVTEYFFQLGTNGVGSSNLYNTGPTTALSAAVTGLPANGETIYARVGSKISGSWQTVDYTYTAASTPAAITAPTPSTTLAASSATFTWNAGVGPTEYFLSIGTTGVGSKNLYNPGPTTALSAAVTGLPANGVTVYVRLGSKIAGLWQTNDYTYTAASTPAAITAPTPSTTLGGSAVTFDWNAGSGPTEYFLSIGTTGVGSKNLYNPGPTTALSAAVTGLPVNGVTVYVRLGSKIDGVWQTRDYTYTAQ